MVAVVAVRVVPVVAFARRGRQLQLEFSQAVEVSRREVHSRIRAERRQELIRTAISR